MIVDAFSKLTTLPKTLRTDGGSEFTNKLFQSFLKNNSIRHYIARNDYKAALAERVIQTLKRKIYQQMVYKTPQNIYQHFPTLLTRIIKQNMLIWVMHPTL